MKRAQCLSMALLAAVLALCACTRAGGEKADTLELWTIAMKPKFIPYFERVLGEFEAKHGIKVLWLDLPQAAIVPKLTASIAGGVPPDVVNLTTGTVLTLARRGALVDVGAYAAPEQRDLYWSNLWQAASYRDGVYAIPWYLSTRVLIYNKDILQRAGWPASTPPRTWQEVAEAADLVKRNTSAFGYEPVIRLLDDWRMAGVSVYDAATGRAAFNCERGRRRLDWYADLRRRGLIPEETLIEGYQGAVDRYKQGNLALLEAGPQLLLGIAADAPAVYAVSGVALLPTGESGEIPAALMNFAIPRSSAKHQAAVQLALFLTNKNNQLALVHEVPLLPSVRVSEAELFASGQRGGLTAEALRCSFVQLPRARDFSLGLQNSQDLEKTLKEAVEMSFYGQAAAGEALRNAEDQWNAIISGNSEGR